MILTHWWYRSQRPPSSGSTDLVFNILHQISSNLEQVWPRCMKMIILVTNWYFFLTQAKCHTDHASNRVWPYSPLPRRLSTSLVLLPKVSCLEERRCFGGICLWQKPWGEIENVDWTLPKAQRSNASWCWVRLSAAKKASTSWKQADSKQWPNNTNLSPNCKVL